MNVAPTIQADLDSWDAGDALSAARADITARVLAALDRAGIAYCVLHNYEQLPAPGPSDIDAIIDPTIAPADLREFFFAHRAELQATLVHARGRYVVLGRTLDDGQVVTVAFDFVDDVTIKNTTFYRGRDILGSRRSFRSYWTPAPHMAFGCLLVRSLCKGALCRDRTDKLTTLYLEDPERGACEARRLLGEGEATLVLRAVSTGGWANVQGSAGALSDRAIGRARRSDPVKAVANAVRAFVARIGRLAVPDGLSVVLLGPDGAGKSSMVEALTGRNLDLFSGVECRGFAPKIFGRVLHRSNGPTDQPHALPPRSPTASIIRAGYWLAYYHLSGFDLRMALSRSRLVLYDRHFVDILVDQRRYRYGGPQWLLRLVHSAIPKPDLVLLLDAPAEVLQQRKQELSFEETVRQRDAYLSLVQALPNGRVLDASQPFQKVVETAAGVLTNYLAERTARRGNLSGVV